MQDPINIVFGDVFSFSILSRIIDVYYALVQTKNKFRDMCRATNEAHQPICMVNTFRHPFFRCAGWRLTRALSVGQTGFGIEFGHGNVHLGVEGLFGVNFINMHGLMA